MALLGKFRKPMSILCSFLISMASIIVVHSSCAFLWGEPECPECLREGEV